MNPLYSGSKAPSPSQVMDFVRRTDPMDAQRRVERTIADLRLTGEQVEWAKGQAMELGRSLGLIK